MQTYGATKIELDLLDVLRWNESQPCSSEATQRSLSISNAIEELQHLRSTLEKTLEYVEDFLARHDHELGRTTSKNRNIAIDAEELIKKVKLTFPTI